MTSNKLEYKQQNAAISLRQGIEEYHRANPNIFIKDGIDPEAQEFLDLHDRIHVVFGCDTSFREEMMADLWTMYGSDLGFLGYAKYIKNPALKMIGQDFQERGNREAMRKEIKASLLPSLVLWPKIFWRSRRMKQKWPWKDGERYLDMPLGEIRKQLGIQILD